MALRRAAVMMSSAVRSIWRSGRAIMLGAAAVGLCIVFFWVGERAAVAADAETARAIHGAVASGRVDLIDIRRPSEWSASGLAEGASPITMHQPFETFLAAVKARAKANGGRPLAIICAGGVRTSAMQRRLAQEGVQVIDVRDGMFGNWSGDRGWIKSGLPVRAWSPKP